jgi:hypothetical protein
VPGPNGSPYCSPTNLGQYLPAATLSLATAAQQQQACTDATNRADAYMNGRYAMPLLEWSSDVTTNTAYIAIFLLMGMIGFAPQAGSDDNILRNYYTAIGGGPYREPGFFPGIQAQRVHPSVTPSVPIGSDPGHDAPQVMSDPPRGWPQFRNGRSVVGGY